ncbi:Acetylglutamate kinase [Streptomyces microflavus]
MSAARKHTALPKAQILIEALPWLTRHNGKTVVIKFGGNAMIDEELKAAFAQDVVFLRHAGLKPVVVHGGGPQISAQLDKQGLVSEFKAGLRVTTPEAMDVVRMVLAGQVQRELVGLLNQHGPLAVGMTGEDAHTITAVQHRPTIDGESVDIGRVGEITAIDTGAIQALLDDGRIPVVSSIARSADDHHVYNVNADTAAAALAAALNAETLMVLTDVEGLYEDWPEQRRRHQPAHREPAGEAAAGAVQRHGPQDAGLPARRAQRRGDRPRHRRPGPALDPAGDLHRRGHRHDGRAGRPHRRTHRA